MATDCAEDTHYQTLVESEANVFFEAAGAYLKPEEIQLLRNAFAVAQEAHAGQARKSGEPYITHPLAVATLLAEWHVDVQGLAVGLLHDVLEDTGVTKSRLKEQFGKVIADLVDGLSKLERLKYQTKEDAHAESFRKMVLAMAKDIRVIIVKLADRLHNMRTLDSMRLEKRRRIASETLEIYAPIANRIGLNAVYRELQDLSFRHLHPLRYAILAKAMRAARGNRRELVTRILQGVSQQLVQHNIEAIIKGREKNLYSIYKKMREKKLTFSEVLDIYGFRIIVNDVPSCYLALGALHALYKPIPGKFKDYIAIPKGNGYQSLHTTLFGPYGTPVEMQIRTRAMNGVAESGVASHWIYKSGEVMNTAQQRTHQWLQNILDMQKESDDAQEFLEHMKIDLFPDEVYVFTPKGRIMVMAQGSTAVDFAYAVHTDIGHRCIAARVNYSLVPLRTVLRNGDTVEIITSTQAKPNPSWLSFVQSGRARSGIRNYLKGLKYEEAMRLGERLLKQTLSSIMVMPLDLNSDLLAQYVRQYGDKKTTFDDVYADMGSGKTIPLVVAKRLCELAGEKLGENITVAPIVIRGSEGGMVQFSNCCHPLPGDAVQAIIEKEQGLIIHQEACPNLKKADPKTLMAAKWDVPKELTFAVWIEIVAKNECNTLADIAAAISHSMAQIESAETKTNINPVPETISLVFRLQVHSTGHLSEVMAAVQILSAVQQVVRR